MPRQSRRFGIAAGGNALGSRQVYPQPGLALLQRLRVGVDAAHVLHAPGKRMQALVHMQFHLAADDRRGREEHVQRHLDHALAGVLHRHDTEIRVAGSHLLKHFLDAAQRQTVRGMPEMLEYRLLAEGALRAEVTDLQRLLLRQARGHDLAKQPHHLGVRQRAIVAVHHHAQHMRLPLRAVIVDRRQALTLDGCHFPRAPCTLGDQLLDLAIETVNALAHIAQRSFLITHGLAA